MDCAGEHNPWRTRVPFSPAHLVRGKSTIPLPITINKTALLCDLWCLLPKQLTKCFLRANRERRAMRLGRAVRFIQRGPQTGPFLLGLSNRWRTATCYRSGKARRGHPLGAIKGPAFPCLGEVVMAPNRLGVSTGSPLLGVLRLCNGVDTTLSPTRAHSLHPPLRLLRVSAVNPPSYSPFVPFASLW